MCQEVEHHYFTEQFPLTYQRLCVCCQTMTSPACLCGTSLQVRALEGHVIVQVAAGGTHTLAISSEGRLWSWGRASFGRLGTGTAGPGKKDMDAYSPVEVIMPGV